MPKATHAIQMEEEYKTYDSYNLSEESINATMH